MSGGLLNASRKEGAKWKDCVDCLVRTCQLQLALSFLRHLDHHFSPSITRSKCYQGLRNCLESSKLLVCITCAAELATIHEIEQTLPHYFDHLGLIDSVCTPMQTHNADVLQKNPVGRHLLNVACCKANDQKASVPSCALHALGNETNGVVNDVYTTALGSKLLDPFRPVLFSVVNQMVCTEGLCNVQLMLCASCRDDCCSKSFRNLDRRQTYTSSSSMNQNPVTC
jgi:hypothetical protein